MCDSHTLSLLRFLYPLHSYEPFVFEQKRFTQNNSNKNDGFIVIYSCALIAEMRSYTALAVLATLLVTTTCFQYDCSKMEYDRCVRIADPLVKEAHLIFPDNLDDIDLVCRTWNKFVDCLKRYTDNCFTEQQRRQFNKAVENPIESVHQMCMIPHYQKGTYARIFYILDVVMR